MLVIFSQSFCQQQNLRTSDALIKQLSAVSTFHYFMTIAHFRTQQDKAKIEQSLITARQSLTAYKAKVDSLDAELADARTELQAIEAEKTKLLLELKMFQRVPATLEGNHDVDMQSQELVRLSSSFVDAYAYVSANRLLNKNLS